MAADLSSRPSATCWAEAGSGNLTGTSGDDVIVGSEIADMIDGLGGNDRICGLAGSDQLAGGLGNDLIVRLVQGAGRTVGSKPATGSSCGGGSAAPADLAGAIRTHQDRFAAEVLATVVHEGEPGFPVPVR